MKELSPNQWIIREFSDYVYFKVTQTIKITCTRSKSTLVVASSHIVMILVNIITFRQILS